jgi:peptide deformylase
MSVREVLVYPNRLLKEVAAPLQADRLEEISRDLLDTMDSMDHCVGLAAPQLGELVRVVAVDVRGHPKADTDNGRLVLANPRIVSATGSEVGREGCLSIPDLTANVRRATEVVVEHLGGKVRSKGFEARCIQHEMDHLDGVLFLDRVESLVDDVFRRRTYASEREEAGSGSAGSSG